MQNLLSDFAEDQRFVWLKNTGTHQADQEMAVSRSLGR
jgi:hypothetical protein